MNRQKLISEIRRKRSFLCVGLDSDPLKLPAHIAQDSDGVLAFNKAIIDATAPYAVAYKPNAAFYEAMGSKGIEALEATVAYLQNHYPECMVILDAKRGDIGNTSGLYARAAFEQMGVDAITVAPYMGIDSVEPFLGYPEKWVVLLALTSNSGSSDFQQLDLIEGGKLYEQVLRTSQKWATKESMMYVVGATRAEFLEDVRKIVPDHFLLVPGVGAQGGSLEEVSKYGMTPECGLLVNSSRGIIFTSQGEDFAEVAGAKARELQEEMSGYLSQYAGI
ncbi:orotidine-5'-phosphate decarboxylase [Porphyromonas levii]|uniref:orotidine-5'-phosphate decarboxylase n=1 Tax=Porphyromonas levii TaxID=28114 RepID=UPI001B8B1945|nr:orotidine-5'-phosphate decarboxylase [Porphyromonas levii]MBR8703445.1 Orotidine 5'-phosphate decarboxylase [Porphyromonas levii]MBR8713397.1 Orotidine 5'-phosphate decarboxylase [Porphyromonas levii]MBR8715432.1 Orotidine 5'-phosphate decarboxylase [Porphyromonas levii]MBR8727917.1 Orotidine 5'-phosphate decarboxylase [Porphyromonas levii]MBR8729774.1 Orotidine 5'-phosphate decarboxylase [Porphyromonas levii]